MGKKNVEYVKVLGASFNYKRVRYSKGATIEVTPDEAKRLMASNPKALTRDINKEAREKAKDADADSADNTEENNDNAEEENNDNENEGEVKLTIEELASMDKKALVKHAKSIGLKPANFVKEDAVRKMIIKELQL